MSHEHEGDMAMSEMNEEEWSITDAQESCSHCIMHPLSGVNLPSAPIVLSNSTSQDVVPAAPAIVSQSIAWTITFVDVHDHGPPGLKGSRYILISSFRI